MNNNDNNKGEWNLAKGNTAQLIMTCGKAHNCFVDIFCHIRQVAAHITKLVLGYIWDSYLGGGRS